MAKKLYYHLQDEANDCWIIMELSGCASWIEAEMEGIPEGETDRKWIIIPVWMTDEEFNNLPEFEG